MALLACHIPAGRATKVNSQGDVEAPAQSIPPEDSIDLENSFEVIIIAEMETKRYIVWSKREVDLQDPWQRKWWVQQVLVHGRSWDVAALDWNEVEQALPELNLPIEFRQLWEAYFAYERAQASV